MSAIATAIAIAIAIEPNSVVRIFCDCRAADGDRGDAARIARAIEVVAAIDAAAEALPQAA
jgi:hypothetical protein